MQVVIRALALVVVLVVLMRRKDTYWSSALMILSSILVNRDSSLAESSAVSIKVLSEDLAYSVRSFLLLNLVKSLPKTVATMLSRSIFSVSLLIFW